MARRAGRRPASGGRTSPTFQLTGAFLDNRRREFVLFDDGGDLVEGASQVILVELGALGAVQGEQDAPGIGLDEEGGDDGAKAAGVSAALEGVKVALGRAAPAFLLGHGKILLSRNWAGAMGVV